jgi:hypothetical protein
MNTHPPAAAPIQPGNVLGSLRGLAVDVGIDPAQFNPPDSAQFNPPDSGRVNPPDSGRVNQSLEESS